MDADNEGRLIGGRYMLAEQIGRGGMGAVWRARDQVLGREVAVKEMLPQAGADDAERARLRERATREARAAARLSHPAVVRVYDVVEEDDRPWIVMELVPSRSLAEVIRSDGPMAVDRVAEIGLAMVDALRTAHGAGILHRDVKPGNVLMTLDGRAVLSDFGIAIVEGDSSVTQSGVVLGAPAYIPPERARGLDPTAASDLWSLGATLYAAIEGKAPFERSTPIATLTAIVSEEPEPAKQAGPLNPVLLALLDRDPERRPDAAEAESMLREALREIRAEQAATRALVMPPVPARRVRESPSDEIPKVAAVATPVPAPPAAPTGAPPVVPEERGRRPFPWMPLPAAIAALVVFGVALGLILFLLVPGDDDPSTTAGDAPNSGAQSTGSQSQGQSAPALGSKPSGPASQTGTAPAAPEPSSAATRTTPESSPSGSPSTTASQQTTTAPPPATTTPGGLPAGWTEHTGATSGFRVGLPPGWRLDRTEGTQEFFKNDANSSWFSVDTTSEPQGDPVADWRELEPQARGNFSNYSLLTIQKATYRDYPAAAWEFTHGSPRRHVLNLGFVTGDNRGYALYFSTPATAWNEPATVAWREGIKDSFRP